MMVIDTSALLAILQDEAQAGACLEAIERNIARWMSAATLAEALIVAARRGIAPEMTKLLNGLGLEIVPVTAASARKAAAAYQRWGKGVHPAGLNYGDCFAYALADEKNCPLLYVGHDFAQTDIYAALSPAP